MADFQKPRLTNITCSLGATPIRGSFFGNITVVLISNVQCSGYERRLVDCENSVWNSNICPNYTAAGVICTGKISMYTKLFHRKKIYIYTYTRIHML